MQSPRDVFIFPDRVVEFEKYAAGIRLDSFEDRKIVTNILYSSMIEVDPHFLFIVKLKDYLKNCIKLNDHYINPNYPCKINGIILPKETIKKIYERNKQLQRDIL